MKPHNIYIFNITEDVWPLIQSISNKKDYYYEIEWCANAAERDLITIAKEDKPIFICPKSIDKNYIEYVKQLFSIKEITVLTPHKNTGEISKDILNDDDITNKLVKLKNVVITSYSASKQFSDLTDYLRKRGLNINSPELPDKSNLWTVDYFGSKSGIRKVIPKLMASGIIYDSTHKLINEAIKLKEKYKLGIVIKTNKGHGGEGVKIIKKNKITKLFLNNIFNKNDYWKKFPIVVEELIKVRSTPNVEFFIDSEGKVNFLYYCSMRVDNNGFYKGQEVHNTVIPKKLADELIKIGSELGKRYSKSGYRGYFDVDYIIGKNNKVYVTESNTRHTGGTHVYKAAKSLIGDDFMMKSYVLSNNDYLLPRNNLNFSKIKDILKPILFDYKSKEGIVIASSNLIKLGIFSYIIFGKNKKRSLDTEKRMGVLLEI